MKHQHNNLQLRSFLFFLNRGQAFPQTLSSASIMTVSAA